MRCPRPSLLAFRRRLGSIAGASIAALILTACSSSPSSPNASDSGATPTFSEIYADILNPSCAMACHLPGGLGVTEGMLDMSTQTAAYNNLVGVDGGVEATGGTAQVPGCAGKGERVVKGNFEMSILAEKVDPNLFKTLNCGSLMPLGGGALPQSQIEDIEAWITAGAPNN